MHILFYISRFGIGGIQTFVIQLAKELIKNEGVKVSIFCHYPELIDQALNEPIPAAIEILTLTDNPKRIIWINRIRNLIKKIIPGFDFKEWLTQRRFLQLVHQNNVSIIHNNIEVGDQNVRLASQKIGVPYITTLHGAYKNINQESSLKIREQYRSIFEKLLDTASNVVYLSTDNIKPFKIVLGDLTQVQQQKFVRIFNGLSSCDPIAYNSSSSATIVFGLMARGVHYKGWEEAIIATIQIKTQYPSLAIQLKLVGASQYLDTLKEQYKAYADFIIFHGATNRPLDLVQTFTVGLLPTYLPQEEMPYTVIEYLACQLPVIATNKGAIQEMLSYEGAIAGEIISFDSQGKADISHLVTAMQRFIEDDTYRAEKTALSANAFQKFDISNTAKQYHHLYQKAINQ